MSLTLYRTDPLRVVAEITGEEQPLAALVDVVSPQLLDRLDLPAARASESADGPVQALLSPSTEALVALFAAEHALASKRDLPAAKQLLHVALELDPDFALAGLRLYQLGAGTGDTEALRRGLDIAFGNRERFTEDLRCAVRIAQAGYAGQTDSARRIARACVERFPFNPETRLQYAGLLLGFEQNIEAAIQQYEQVIALGGPYESAMLQIARLRERLGEEEQAARVYADYLRLRPFDPAASMALAALEERRGQGDAARERLLDATAHHDRAPELTGALAMLLVRQGRHEQALRTIRELETSDQLMQRDLALRVREREAESTGRIRDALTFRDQRIEATATGTLALAQLTRTRDYAEYIDGVPGILTEYDSLLDAAYPGENEIARLLREYDRLLVALRVGNANDVERGREAAQALISRFGRKDLGFLLTLVEARVQQLRGEPAEAARAYARAHAAFRRDGGEQVLSEVQLLRMWLEAASAAGDAASGETPDLLLSRLLPAHPRALLLRAEFHAATNQRERALALARDALEACRRCDADYGPRGAASVLLERLAVDPAP